MGRSVIIDVLADIRNAVGLKRDCAVIVAESNEGEQNAVEGWQGIVGVASNNGITVGIKEDGTLVCTFKFGTEEITAISDVKCS